MKISLQTLRKYAINPDQIDRGRNSDEPVFYWFGNILDYSEAHDCAAHIRHRGWFTDSDCSSKAVAVVFELPSCPGFPNGRFLAGYHWTDNGEFVAWPELFKDKTEAARRADSHAERFAELAREDNARFEAMQDAESEADEAQQAAKLAIMARNVSSEHRDIAREKIEELRAAREKLAEATEAYERG